MKNYMTIGLDPEDPTKAGVNISPELDAATALRLLGTLTSHLLNAYYIAATKDLDPLQSSTAAACTGIKESLYDSVDTVISTALSNFYPEAANLSLEDEAILKLTDQLIVERYAAMSDEDKAAYSESYNKLVAKLESDAHES